MRLKRRIQLDPSKFLLTPFGVSENTISLRGAPAGQVARPACDTCRDLSIKTGRGTRPDDPAATSPSGTVRQPEPMEVNALSSAAPKRLPPRQKELWDQMQPHVPKPSGDQTPQQAVNLGIDSFLFLLDFEGIGPSPPTAEAIQAEFDEAGVPELCPDADHLEDVRLHPTKLWYLAP